MRALRIRLGALVVLAGLGAACSKEAAPRPDTSLPGGTADGSAGPTGSGGSFGFGGAGSISTGQGGQAGSAPSTGTGVTGGAGSGSVGAAGTTGGAGTGSITGAAGGTGPADAGSGDGSVPSCQLFIVALEPGTTDQERAQGTDGLEPGPGVLLRLLAKVALLPGADAGAVRWTWTANMQEALTGAGKRLNPVLIGAGDIADIPMEAAGQYQITATNGLAGCPQASKTVVVAARAPPQFLFRVTPPAAAQLPTREFTVDGANPSSTALLSLGDATATELLRIAPTDVRSLPIAAYVRITSASLGFGVEGYTGRGPLLEPLASAISYRVLVLPDANLAPLLVTGSPDDIQAALAPALGAGVPVTGTASDGDQRPVVGARIVLQAGDRPSTIGVSGGDGSFSLLTRAGTLSADVAPPEGSGLPEAHVAGSPGILLPAGAAQLALSMSWAKISTGVLAVKVTDPAGALVVGARVRAELTGTPPVGALSVNAPGLTSVSLAATGAAHAQGTTDATGVARLAPLPVGAYHLTVSPPDSLSSAAITGADVTLASADLAAAVKLAPPVSLAGALLPRDLTVGSQVTALDRGPLAASTMATATVDANGAYALALAAGRTYELLVEPPAGRALGRNVFAIVPPTFAGGPQSDVLLAARAWSGTVTGAGHAIAGALVQVYCVRPPASCLDPTFAVAQGTTGPEGTLTLTLPGLPPNQ